MELIANTIRYGLLVMAIVYSVVCIIWFIPSWFRRRKNES
jgi:hypothetical protein